MKRAVGLIVLTDVPEMGRVAVLQVRGTFNPETMKPESYPGTCQVTCHGKAEGSETEFEVLLREAGEELGNGFTSLVFHNRNFLTDIVRFSTETKEIVTFGLMIPDPRFLKDLRLSASSGGIRLITKETPLSDLKTFTKSLGVLDRTIVAMFPDEAEAVRKAFEVFS